MCWFTIFIVLSSKILLQTLCLTKFTKVSKIMTAYAKHRQAGPGTAQSELTDSDGQTLSRIVAKFHKSTATKIYRSTESAPLWPTLKEKKKMKQAVSFTRLAFTAGLLIGNRWCPRPMQRCITWCIWTLEQWEVIWFDESSRMLPSSSGWVYIWWNPKNAFKPQCSWFVMLWAPILAVTISDDCSAWSYNTQII